MASCEHAIQVPRGQQAGSRGTTDYSLPETVEQLLPSHVAHRNLMGRSSTECYCGQLLGTKASHMPFLIQREKEEAARRRSHPSAAARPITAACGLYPATSVRAHGRHLSVFLGQLLQRSGVSSSVPSGEGL